MNEPSPDRPRARLLIPILLGLLALVLLARLLIGLPDFLLFGLVGGLAICLLVVARDTLLSARRQLEEQEDARRREAERTERLRDERE